MEPTGENHYFVLPPALLAEVMAAADEEHRPVADIVRDLVERGLGERRKSVGLGETKNAAFNHSSEALPAKRTPAEAAARMRILRKGTFLPEGETIRSMIDHGRA